MVFDSKGGFYFTDFRGYSTNPKGGVYYVSPDFKTVTPVIQNISVANGVALSTDEKYYGLQKQRQPTTSYSIRGRWRDNCTVWRNDSILLYWP